jgi:hypothetical protein
MTREDRVIIDQLLSLRVLPQMSGWEARRTVPALLAYLWEYSPAVMRGQAFCQCCGLPVGVCEASRGK